MGPSPAGLLRRGIMLGAGIARAGNRDPLEAAAGGGGGSPDPRSRCSCALGVPDQLPPSSSSSPARKTHNLSPGCHGTLFIESTWATTINENAFLHSDWRWSGKQVLLIRNPHLMRACTFSDGLLSTYLQIPPLHPQHSWQHRSQTQEGPRLTVASEFSSTLKGSL